MKKIWHHTGALLVAYLTFVLAIAIPNPTLAQAGAPGTPPTFSAPREEGSDERRLGIISTSELSLFRGRPEFALWGTTSAVANADVALLAAGAQLLRIRPLPAFDREIRFYDFQGQLDLLNARLLVEEASPTAVLDVNALYRFSQGASPRIYAPELVNDRTVCRLGPGVTIGMIDGPVDTAHPALLDADRPVGSNHGTAIAGLLVGDDGDGTFAGFASGARLVAVAAFAREPGGPGADIDRLSGALDVLGRTGTDVVNMSFAGPPNAVFEALLAEMARRGVVLVSAAGNTNSDAIVYPAGAPDVISVTAVDASLRTFRGASFGESVEFAAPGVDLFVAEPGSGGRYASGTSYAAPIVSAFVARLNAQGVQSVDAVREILRASSRDLGPPGRDAATGWGLVTATDC